MAAKGLVRHMLMSEDFRHVEKNILAYIMAQNVEDAYDADYLESLDIIACRMLEIDNTNTDVDEFAGTTKLLSKSKSMSGFILQKILTNICFPLLRLPRPTTYDQEKGNKLKVLQLTYKLVTKISLGTTKSLEIAQLVWPLVLESLKNFVNECKHGFGEGHETDPGSHVLEIATALDLLANLLDSMSSWHNEREKLGKLGTFQYDIETYVFEAVLDVLKVVRNGSLLYKITGKVLPKLLAMDDRNLLENSERIWQAVKYLLLQEDGEHQCHSSFFASYAIMSSLVDIFFSPEMTFVYKVHHDPAFWRMLQTGLVSIDSLARKQCLFLLQKAIETCKERSEKICVDESCPVFWWDPGSCDELFNIWQQYVFLFEILEEKQLHVIKPVLTRVADLIEGTKKFRDFGISLLHVSWLTLLVHRAILHENRFIKKWGVMTLMTLDLHVVPVVENEATRIFICDTLILLLKEPTLYAKNDGEEKGEPSRLSKELTGFFRKCFEVIYEDDDKKDFVHQLLSSIYKHNLSHVPCTYICQGIGNLPHYPVFGEQLLTNLRHILSSTTGHSIALRGAVQTFLLRIFMNLLDPTSVHLDDVFNFIALFPKEESLSRGVSLWNEVAQWLLNNVRRCQSESQDLFSFLFGKVQILLSSSAGLKDNRVHATRLAKFVLLCYDSLAISFNQVVQLLDSIFATITKAQSNPYHSMTSCWQAVGLLRALLREYQPSVSSTKAITDNMIIAFMNRLHEVLLGFIGCQLRNIDQDPESVSFSGYQMCFELFNEVKNLWATQTSFPDAITRLYQSSIRKLAETVLRLFCTHSQRKPTTIKGWLNLVVIIKWMVWLLEFADVLEVPLGTDIRNGFCEAVKSWDLHAGDFRYPKGQSANDSALSQDEWRILAEDYVAGQWQCVNMVLAALPKLNACPGRSENRTLIDSTASEILDVCTDALSLISRHAVFPCLETLQLLFPKLIDDEVSCLRLLRTAWSTLNEIRVRCSAQFWSVYDIVVKIIFAAELFALPSDHSLSTFMSECWKSLLVISHDQSGLVSVAVHHIYRVLSATACCTLANHIDMIADICVFGPVHKKDLKLLLDTVEYIKRQGESTVWCFNRKEFECEFSRVRIDIVAFLLSLDPSDKECALFIAKLVENLLVRNEVLSKAKASRYLNSENHRHKQRLWQIILLLVHRIHNSDYIFSNFVTRFLEALQSDNQTSVRFLMEWTLVSMFSKPGQDLEVIFKQLENVCKKRLGYVASLITIVTHIFFTLNDVQRQLSYLLRMLPLVIPCAFLNHSQTRAYILDSLRCIREACPGNLWAEVTGNFPMVSACLAFADAVVEGDKEKVRLEKDRALFALHPVNDWSIETIFETVPMITGVIQGEVISAGEFASEGSFAWTEVPGLPLSSTTMLNANQTREEAGVTDVVTTDPALAMADNILSDVPVNQDVQKKITPWQVIAPPGEDLDVFDQLQQRPLQRRVGELVVVASLIDRAPNLGGLCRTCEIFGASRLVIGSKHVVSEMAFKSVSVSSEKWVDVEAVKVNELSKYLSNMRKEGFTIVGVEQTARSKKLTAFQFPLNTVLVLGNEKSGIPVEFIQLLDECVEIPQHGVIRSLNVHVSGALFIWEYSRQHLNDS